MAEKQAVLLCGQSLCMAGLACLLRNDAEFEVTAVPGPDESRRVLEQKQIAAIFFDTQEFSQAMVAAMITNYPGVLLIGLNAENSMTFVFSCHQDKTETVNDLKKIIATAVTSDACDKANRLVQYPQNRLPKGEGRK